MQRLLAVLLALLAATVGAAGAEDRAGDFDFYVLSLSWSPSYCEAEGDERGSAQCERGRRFDFIVHGLWPQHERGYPDFCAVGERPSRATVLAMLDLMPDPGLVAHQWKKHGSCSGLEPGAYFGLVRKARDAIAIPASFRQPDRPLRVDAAAVEEAFVEANRGLSADAVAIDCDKRRLREVRVCMTRDLAFRPCPEVDRRGCRRHDLVMPKVR